MRVERQDLVNRSWDELRELPKPYFYNYPHMPGADLVFFEQELEAAVKRSEGRPVSILEWGTGGSTVYFSKLLEKWNAPYRWLGVETNPEWAVNICKRSGSFVEMVLFDRGIRDLRAYRGKVDLEEYIKYPSTRNDFYDLILVDGRCRRRCLLETPSLLHLNGVVLLHDSDRPYYHCALNVLPGRFIENTAWWKGVRESAVIPAR